ncbi:hypothetical protein ASF59_21845 [Methylobacterium sp. Leaf121]|nr:hypothetical protein ASF59_21845 [Methylobacterium sp. Leaf121]
MQAHGAGDAPPPRLGMRGVGAVGDMIAGPELVGADVVAAQHRARALRDEDMVGRGEPVGERPLPVPVPRQGVGLPRAQDRLQDRPDRVVVTALRRADQEVGHRGRGRVRCKGAVQ